MGEHKAVLLPLRLLPQCYPMLRWMAKASEKRPDAYLLASFRAGTLTIDEATEWCNLCGFSLAVAFFHEPPMWWIRMRLLRMWRRWFPMEERSDG